jgi:Flp pilus assembly pilin Flp
VTLKSFLRDEQGQDLVEYSFVLASMALVFGGLTMNAGGISGLWKAANNMFGPGQPPYAMVSIQEGYPGGISVNSNQIVIGA